MEMATKYLHNDLVQFVWDEVWGTSVQ